MKQAFFIALLLFTLHASAQDTDRTGVAFFEGGLGYSFNTDGPFNYYPEEDILVGYGNFTHGIKPYLHFGVLAAKTDAASRSLQIGLAASYSRPYYLTFERNIRKLYEKEFPGLDIRVSQWPFFRLSSMEMGVILGGGTDKFAMYAECLLGASSIRIPYLLVTGDRMTDNGVQRELYLYRPPQVIRFNNLDSRLTYRRYTGQGKYWFITSDLALGLSLDGGDFTYQRVPVPVSYDGRIETGGYIDYYALLSISAGVGISIR